MIKHACVMVLVVGCSGGSDHGTVALTDLGTELGTAYCMKEFSCCTACSANDACSSDFCNGVSSGNGTCADKPARCDGR